MSDLVGNPEDRFSRVEAHSIKTLMIFDPLSSYLEVHLCSMKYEPPRGKTNNVVSEQVRHKPACTVTE